MMNINCFFSLFVIGAMSGAAEEFLLEDEPGATHGSNAWEAAEVAHTWLDGVALGLSTRGSDHTHGVYPFLAEDCYCSDSCIAVL